MDEAEVILQRIRDAGFRLHAITGNGHWFMFAYRGEEEFSVRGDDYLRVAAALAAAVGLSGDGTESDPYPPKRDSAEGESI